MLRHCGLDHRNVECFSSIHEDAGDPSGKDMGARFGRVRVGLYRFRAIVVAPVSLLTLEPGVMQFLCRWVPVGFARKHTRVRCSYTHRGGPR